MNTFEHLGPIGAQGGGGYPPGGYGPPGGGGYGPPGAPPGGGYPPGGGAPPGGYGPPGGGGAPPGGYGPPGGGGAPPGGYGPPGGGYPPGGGAPPGGYGPPGGGGAPPGGYGPPGGGYPPGGGAPPGGYGPPGGGAPPGGYGPPGGGPPGGLPHYAPPGGFAPPPYQPGAPPPGGGSGFEATEPIAFGWNAITKDYAGIGLPLAVAVFVASIPGAILGGIRGGIVAALTASGSADPMMINLITGVGGVVEGLVSLLMQAYLLGGATQFALRVARGEKPAFNVVFSGGPFLVSLFGATILSSFGTFFGLALCIVPGLILYAGWALYAAFIVDKRVGAIEALTLSWRTTAPHRMNIVVYGLLTFLVCLGGVAACCIGFLLVSFPVLMIGNAYLYLKLTGEQPRLPS